MISYISGILKATFGNTCVIVTNGGIGFNVFVPAHTLQTLPKIGEQVAFHTSLIVRDDALELFGFSTFDELQTFEQLIKISKVGARTAQAILSIFRPDDLRRLVTTDDSTQLLCVPGIGKKTAQHIFLELKDKLGIINTETIGLDLACDQLVLRNVVDGLAGLGYSEKESIQVASGILKENPSLTIAEALRASLKAMSDGK